MVQGSKKMVSQKPGAVKKPNAAKFQKQQANAKQARKGNPHVTKRRIHSGHTDRMEEIELSKAIDRSNEQKMAAKVLQGGGLMLNPEFTKKGKELNKEKRVKMVKKKLTRVEEKLKELKTKAEKEGLI